MGLKKQYQVRMRQRQKRKAKRRRLSAKKHDLNDYFYGSYYIKLGASSS